PAGTRLLPRVHRADPRIDRPRRAAHRHRRGGRDVLHRRPLRIVHGGPEMTPELSDRLVVALDLDGVTDKAGLMEHCARALELPDWFGRNWDALVDSLADPTLWPEGAVERGLLIVVRGWRAYAAARPEEWATA